MHVVRRPVTLSWHVMSACAARRRRILPPRVIGASPPPTFHTPPAFLTMATLLDQSLDAIIASTRQKRAAASGRVGKGVARGAVKKAAAKKTAPKKAAPQPATGAGKKTKAKTAAAVLAPRVKVIEASSYATKIVVHGLPKDILSDAVKVCLCWPLVVTQYGL